MTPTRWKVMAGVLGLSLGGLAAIAEPPAAKSPEIGVSSLLPPEPVAIPTVPAISAPVTVPTVTAAPCPACDPAAKSCPTVTTKTAVEVAPPPRSVTEQEQIIDMTVPAAAIAVPGDIAPQTIPVAASAPVEVTTSPVIPAAPTPVSSVPTTPAPVSTGVQQAPVPAPAAAAVTPAVAPTVTDKKLRVLLNMGEDRPRFEVKDGEETLLKLVSDKVDVKCPADRGEALPTMKAVGAVSFYTPGGEGVCDELTLTPGTGQVVVTGKVRFRYHWGKVETEVSGDRMTFRLGAAPGVTTAVPAATTAVPVSYQTVR